MKRCLVTVAVVLAFTSGGYADEIIIDLFTEPGAMHTSIFHAMPNSNTGGEGPDKVVGVVGEDLTTALYYFDMSALLGAKITSATFTVNEAWWNDPIPDVQVRRIDSPVMWEQGSGLWSAKWSNNSGAGMFTVDWDAAASSGHDWAGNSLDWWDPAATQLTSALADVIDTGMLNSGGTTDYDITSLVQNWADGTWENKGFALYAGEVSEGGVSHLNSAVVRIETAPPFADVTETDGGTTVFEEGETWDTFSLVLREDPLGEVEITLHAEGVNSDANDLAPSDANDIRLDDAAAGEDIVLIFDSSNWNIPREVTVTAVDDTNQEDFVETATIFFEISAGDPNEIFIFPVMVSVVDNDSAGIIITETDSATIVAEGGVGGNPETDTFTIELFGEPQSEVIITLTELVTLPNDPEDIEIEPSVVTFQPDDYSPRTVTVTAIDDTITEQNGLPHSGDIMFSVTSADLAFNNSIIANLVVELLDNECGSVGYNRSDLNNDCRTDLADLAIFALDYLSCTFPNIVGCP